MNERIRSPRGEPADATRINTSDFYGPYVTNEIIRRALPMTGSLPDKSMSMKAHPHAINHEDWNLSLWFAIFSPLIGIGLGMLALFAWTP